ncbi:hypothetical protein GCM10023063_16760 [Arthrobacter methylotrophus]
MNFSGSSVRKNLDPLGRELLVERIRTVAETGKAIDDVVNHRGEDYRVLARPINSPMTDMVLAVLAIYVAAGDDLPPRPPIGALEWKISFNGHIETSWNDDLFAIYELDRTGESPTGDMNQWVSELISAEDRTRMKVTIDAAITSVNAERYLVPYRIITRFNSDSPGVKNLEVSGRVVTDEKRQGKWLRAITREVQEITPSPITPGFGDFQSSSLLRAVFELAVDQVLMAVDTSCWQTFMTSNTWHRFGIQSPRYGYLPHVIYPDDYRDFRDTVEAAQPYNRATVRLMHTDGQYRAYTVTASSGHDDHGSTDRYAVVRLSPVEAEEATVSSTG